MTYDESPEMNEEDYEEWLREKETARATAVIHPNTDHCPVCGGDLRWVEAGEV